MDSRNENNRSYPDVNISHYHRDSWTRRYYESLNKMLLDERLNLIRDEDLIVQLKRSMKYLRNRGRRKVK